MISLMPTLLSLLVILIAISVIIGWIFGIEILKSWIPLEISMKFSVAICFLLCGFALLSSTFYIKGSREWPILLSPITTMPVLFLMGILVLGQVAHITTGVESLLIKESFGAVKTVLPGMPSFPAMIGFVVFGFGSIVLLIESKYSSYINIVLSISIIILSIIAVAGYVFNMPYLYFRVSASATPISINTAAAFLLLGIGQLILSIKKDRILT